jgi:hypothetical protein
MGDPFTGIDFDQAWYFYTGYGMVRYQFYL